MCEWLVYYIAWHIYCTCVISMNTIAITLDLPFTACMFKIYINTFIAHHMHVKHVDWTCNDKECCSHHKPY